MTMNFAGIYSRFEQVCVFMCSVLEKNHSPLLRHLMQYLREFLVDYRKDLAELVGDKQLAKELEYDLSQVCNFLSSINYDESVDNIAPIIER